MPEIGTLAHKVDHSRRLEVSLSWLLPTKFLQVLRKWRNFIDSSSIHTCTHLRRRGGATDQLSCHYQTGAAAAFIDWSKYPIYYDNPRPPHSSASAGTGLADTRMRGNILEYFNILYHTRYWPLPCPGWPVLEPSTQL